MQPQSQIVYTIYDTDIDIVIYNMKSTVNHVSFKHGLLLGEYVRRMFSPHTFYELSMNGTTQNV